MDWRDLISVASLVVGLITGAIGIRDATKSRASMKQVSLILSAGLSDHRGDLPSILKRFDLLYNSTSFSTMREKERQRIRRLILGLRNDLERYLRRICLFTKEKKLLESTVFWFYENAIPEDKEYLGRAIRQNSIPRGRLRRIVKMTVKR